MLCMAMVIVTIGRAGLFCMGAILGCGAGFVNRMVQRVFFYNNKTVKATATPAALHAKLTQSLSSHFQPRMWMVCVPQVWSGCFSVSFWSVGQ